MQDSLSQDQVAADLTTEGFGRAQPWFNNEEMIYLLKMMQTTVFDELNIKNPYNKN
jgi:hypothetical protein